jgi:alpha-D-ribose 1-methylphosphonate 5-triphosphate synthase subunit PhnL
MNTAKVEQHECVAEIESDLEERFNADDHRRWLLDEPTASLDAVNRQVVIELIQEARQRGSAIVGIFHDAEVRDAVATRSFDLERYRA